MEINFNGGTNTKKKKGSGILGGLILLLLGTALLWWNEGNNVRNIKTISEMEKTVVEISSESVSAENDGKLVALNGALVVNDPELRDNDFGIAVHTARLKRIVEMYQWDEDSHTDDDGHTSYTYSKEWSERILDVSHSTTHVNPQTMPYDSVEGVAQEVKVGAYFLSNEQISGLATDKYLSIPTEATNTGYTIQGNYLTSATNIENPEIGDIRISWKYNDWEEASVLAVTSGSTFKDYVSSYDVHINRVDKGLLSSKELIGNQEAENNALKWILRGVGALMILFGYLSLTGPLSRLSSKVPVLGAVVGKVLWIISLLLAVVHSLLIIIIAWFRYRPVLSLVLLAVVIAAIVLIVILSKKKKAEQPQ